MWLAEETKRNLPLELDFLHEGRNCERVERLFKHFSFLKVPKIHWDLSSERVLTMEFCEGGKVDDKAYMEKHGINVNEVTESIKVHEKKNGWWIHVLCSLLLSKGRKLLQHL